MTRNTALPLESDVLLRVTTRMNECGMTGTLAALRYNEIVVMSVEDARDWAERWKEIERAEIAELRALSFEVKFRQLESLMRSSELFDWASADLDETAERDLWIRLRQSSGCS